jgi:hypothetical protein
LIKSHHEQKEFYWSYRKIGLETLCHYLLETYVDKEAIVERDEITKEPIDFSTSKWPLLAL